MEIGELWQTGFTCFKIIGWGRYYLSTVLDDFCRHIIAWILTGTMSADDVKRTVKLVEEKTGIKGVTVKHRPRLLSDNGPSVHQIPPHHLQDDFVEYFLVNPTIHSLAPVVSAPLGKSR